MAASLVALHTTRALANRVLATDTASKHSLGHDFRDHLSKIAAKGSKPDPTLKNEWHIRSAVCRDEGYSALRSRSSK